MRGIELSRSFYEEYGLPLLREEFPEYEGRIAVGIAGKGSECFGFDDELSRDHDYKAGFCLWLTEADEEKIGFRLMRAYSHLPKEYRGVKLEAQSACQTGKFGVRTIDSFFESTIGIPRAPDSWQQWFYLPEHALAEAVNGAVFRDELGEFSEIRRSLLQDMPEDVRLKKLAAHLALAAQAGQYNYPRCLKHGEPAAAQLALSVFAQHVCRIYFILNGGYCPYYKWAFRALRENPHGAAPAQQLTELLLRCSQQSQNENIALIESISADIIAALRRRSLSESGSDYLEQHAFAVTGKIRSREIRDLHIMDFGE